MSVHVKTKEKDARLLYVASHFKRLTEIFIE